MPRCHKARNQDIHETINEQRYEISRAIETLKHIREPSTIWTQEDEKDIERLDNDIKQLQGQSAALYDQFVVSEERLRNMRIAYRQLAQIWLI
ncbi:hypothetical protein TWF281_010527 [Arthrobotrys megalospora]